MLGVCLEFDVKAKVLNGLRAAPGMWTEVGFTIVTFWVWDRR